MAVAVSCPSSITTVPNEVRSYGMVATLLAVVMTMSLSSTSHRRLLLVTSLPTRTPSPRKLCISSPTCRMNGLSFGTTNSALRPSRAIRCAAQQVLP